MSRLIDAEKVYELGHRTPFHIGIADLCDLKELLADVPTVDAVPAVRCRDCKHWLKFESSLIGEVMCCTGQGSVNIQKQPDDFCSYGERKEDGGNG